MIAIALDMCFCLGVLTFMSLCCLGIFLLFCWIKFDSFCVGSFMPKQKYIFSMHEMCHFILILSILMSMISILVVSDIASE